MDFILNLKMKHDWITKNNKRVGLIDNLEKHVNIKICHRRQKSDV